MYKWPLQPNLTLPLSAHRIFLPSVSCLIFLLFINERGHSPTTAANTHRKENVSAFPDRKACVLLQDEIVLHTTFYLYLQWLKLGEVGTSRYRKTWRRSLNIIAMTHPALLFFR